MDSTEIFQTKPAIQKQRQMGAYRKGKTGENCSNRENIFNPHYTTYQDQIERQPLLTRMEPYFEDRTKNLWLRKNVKYFILKRVYKNQSGICPVCGELITNQTRTDLHHYIPKVEGGEDNVTNLVLLHTNCHRQVHSKGNRKMLLGVQTACLIEA